MFDFYEDDISDEAPYNLRSPEALTSDCITFLRMAMAMFTYYFREAMESCKFVIFFISNFSIHGFS